jgi:cyclic nucleotide gated channel
VTTDLKRTAGVFIETAWAGAAYYLLWFMLAGHVSASISYVIFSTFLTHQKQAAVMRSIFDYNISDI